MSCKLCLHTSTVQQWHNATSVIDTLLWAVNYVGHITTMPRAVSCLEHCTAHGMGHFVVGVNKGGDSMMDQGTEKETTQTRRWDQAIVIWIICSTGLKYLSYVDWRQLEFLGGLLGLSDWLIGSYNPLDPISQDQKREVADVAFSKWLQLCGRWTWQFATLSCWAVVGLATVNCWKVDSLGWHGLWRWWHLQRYVSINTLCQSNDKRLDSFKSQSPL